MLERHPCICETAKEMPLPLPTSVSFLVMGVCAQHDTVNTAATQPLPNEQQPRRLAHIPGPKGDIYDQNNSNPVQKRQNTRVQAQTKAHR
jgi:hypothetical protein